MSCSIIKDCIKRGERYTLDLTIQDDETELYEDLTGYAATLILRSKDGDTSYTIGSGITINVGAVENQIQIAIPTADTLALRGDSIEGDLDIYSTPTEVEYSFLLDLEIDRRASKWQ